MNIEFIKGSLGHVALFLQALLLGGGQRQGEAVPSEVKLTTGLLASGEEVKSIRTILLGLPEDDQEIILGLFTHHFGSPENPRSWVKALIVWVKMSRFRTLITDLDIPQREAGTIKTVKIERDSNGGQVTTTTESKIREGGVAVSELLLRRIVKIVRDREAKTGSREEGYQEAISYMRALGIPLLPTRDVEDWVRENIPDKFEAIMGGTRSLVSRLNRYLEKAAEEDRLREENMPWLIRLLRKIV